MKSSTLLAVKELNYPSGSGIEYFDEHFYLIGDDATHLIKLNKELEPVDSVSLYTNTERRISKDVKTDLESITIVRNNKVPYLFLAGSGSALPYRNSAWLVDPSTNEKIELRLDTFYQRLREIGIDEVNIEGLANTPEEIIFVNRGNKTYRKNHLVFTSSGFWNDQENAPVKLIQIGNNTDTAFFNGISGLAYSAGKDQLLLSVSTENTYNSFDDGTIGKSYLWIIKDLSAKKKDAVINPDAAIDLNKLDKRFEGNKIESVCIISETASGMELLLVADNDDGRTVLFKLRLSF